jgi:leucyl aminopeptidase
MHIEVRVANLLQEKCELAVLASFEGDELPTEVAALFEAGDFTARLNQTSLVYTRGAVGPKRLLLVGLGGRAAIDAERIRQAMATVIRQVRPMEVASLPIGLPADLPLAANAVGQACAEGLVLGAYRYLGQRTGLSDQESFVVSDVTLIVAGAADEVGGGANAGSVIADATCFARDLVNLPGEAKTPPLLADAAVALSGRSSGVTVTIFDEHRLAADGFGGILAVGKGSESPPRFIIMEYGADLAGAPTVCLVGKGLTFDSGGLNLKPAESMDTMKNDMGGSAAVFGIMQAVAGLGLPVHLVGLVPSAENMPSGGSYRPGDVITSLSGKTIEILNTDAEGRVIMSDALHYAQRYAPDAIIDLATLTGAVIIALGNIATAVMATDQGLADALLQAGEASGDRAWQLPMWEDYHEMVKSDVADLKNIAGRPAGTITAGTFLAAFAGDRPYAHLDIAGTAWIDNPKKPYHWKGGTGAGVRLVTEYLRRIGNDTKASA